MRKIRPGRIQINEWQPEVGSAGALPRLRGRGEQGDIAACALFGSTRLFIVADRGFGVLLAPPIMDVSISASPRSKRIERSTEKGITSGFTPAHHGLASEAALHRCVSSLTTLVPL